MAPNLLIALSFLALTCAASAADIHPRRFLPESTRNLLQSCSTAGYCQNKVDGLYANPCSEEPTAIIECTKGDTTLTHCPAGLVWNYQCSCCNDGSGPSPTRKLASTNGKVRAAYWGQGAASSTLASICGRYDLIFLSFLPNFGKGQNVGSSNAINIAGHSLTQTKADIKTCQNQGKKIILSIGGGVGNYGFSSTSDAQSTATSIWNAYLGGSATSRPFGDVTLDGVDLDVEAPTGKQYYADFVKTLKGLYHSSSKKFYLTAVPQCPYPDANLGPSSGTALGDAASSFDYVSIQFYNNPSCGGSNTVSGYGPWKTWAKNNNVKLLPAFPAAAKDAGSGFQAASAVAAELNQLKSDSTYGGWNLFTAEDDSGFSSQLPS